MPSNPILGARYVFLDIELTGMQGQKPKTMASGLVGILSKLIGDQNGPFIILFWTKHQDCVEAVLDACKKKNISPVGHAVLEKSDLLNGDNECDLEALVQAIEKQVTDFPAFQLINQWENAANSATIDFINSLASHFSSGENWSREASAVFYKLYKTYVERRESEEPLSQFKYACSMLNRSYLDSLESSVHKNMVLPAEFKLSGSAISPATVSKINSSLLINHSSIDGQPIAGVYAPKNENMKTDLSNHVFKEGKHPTEIQLCQLVVTPECDYAQKKMLIGKDGETDFDYHRVVYGLFWKASDPYDKSVENSRLNNSDALFDIKPLFYNGHIHHLVFHFSTISLCSSHELGRKTLFSLRRDLFSDLQSKASNHVNRLGNSQMKV